MALFLRRWQWNRKVGVWLMQVHVPHQQHQKYLDVGNQCFTLVGRFFYVVPGISLPKWRRIFCVSRMMRQLLEASVEAIILGFERRDSQLVSKHVSNFGYADERRSFRLLIHVQQVAQVDLGREPTQGPCRLKDNLLHRAVPQAQCID